MISTVQFHGMRICRWIVVFTHQFHMLNITRLRPVVRNSGNRRSIHGDDNEKPHLLEGETYSNKQEILALFRRIQSSISAAESSASKVGTNNASTESVLEVLRQSRKQVKVCGMRTSRFHIVYRKMVGCC